MTTVPLSELPEFVRNVRSVLKLLPQQNRAAVVWLRGDLGAGKTTFVQCLARDYGIEEDVTSPTYVLMRSYDIPGARLPSGTLRRYKRLVHIDAYRLEDPKEFLTLRPEQFLEDKDAVVLIEWPEKLGHYAPKPDVCVDFKMDGGESERTINMSKEN
ncbi:MAG: tRNA (adenosine(37)-N6)-threonylcarbamoyltransferase complex ATPase subunit type 1 TsaE [Patescibacteria group bacterium]|nr:tRNA (adenosine(37)-N6)-threonylcarbamoyltransferase complex ATPase subunit type 1 TsaE [Patescibacteria group bacterium]